MTLNKTKNIAILVGAGLLGIYIISRFRGQSNRTTNTNTNPTPNNCPPGEERCPYGTKCYNPNWTYLVDPCA